MKRVRKKSVLAAAVAVAADIAVVGVLAVAAPVVAVVDIEAVAVAVAVAATGVIAGTGATGEIIVAGGNGLFRHDGGELFSTFHFSRFSEHSGLEDVVELIRIA